MGFGPPFLRLGGMDRLALNASLEALIETEGADAQARQAIAEYGLTLPKSKSIELHGVAVHSTDKGTSGHTPEHGTIHMQTGEGVATTEFTRGTDRERVGYFKIWREPAGSGENWIVIADYWKADLGTGSLTELSRQWTLAVSSTGEALWFGERALRSVLRIPFGIGTFGINREVLEEKWGPHPGREHPRGYSVNLLVFR